MNSRKRCTVTIQQHSISSQKNFFFKLVSDVEECQQAENETWRELKALS
jgi:hypothetical protein